MTSTIGIFSQAQNKEEHADNVTQTFMTHQYRAASSANVQAIKQVRLFSPSF